MTDERRILLGRVVGVFGVRGEVKLHSFTEPVSTADAATSRGCLLHRGVERRSAGRTRPRDGQGHGRRRCPASTIATPPRRWSAPRSGSPRSRLPKPKPGEYYWVDLEGLRVVNREGIVLGTVSHLFETGANDVMVVDGERERLIPVHPGATSSSRSTSTPGASTVDWDAGLLAMRVDVLTLFPDFIRTARRSAWSAARRARPAVGRRPGTRAITPPTTTAAWTTARSAAVPAW